MSDQAQALASQNQARRDANAADGGNRPDLVWDDTLTAHAQEWANTMAATLNLDHSGAPEGENIAFYGGTNATAFLMGGVQQWLDEKPKYHGEKIGDTGPGGTYEDWGHYTQIIWPSTTAVGVAIAQGSNGAFFVCGRYLAQGNGQGQSAWISGGNPVPPPPVQGGTSDGVYLVNSEKNGQWTSGFAWYAQMGGNDGQQPGAYININTSNSVNWEGNTYSGTFADGNVFTCSVNANGQQAPANTGAGAAKNNFHNFTVYKDDFRVLYTVDGWNVHTVYWCK